METTQAATATIAVLLKNPRILDAWLDSSDEHNPELRCEFIEKNCIDIISIFKQSTGAYPVVGDTLDLYTFHKWQVRRRDIRYSGEGKNIELEFVLEYRE